MEFVHVGNASWLATTSVEEDRKPERGMWKSYIKAPACCHSFKGSHYIPVTKTVPLYVITETLHTPAPLSFMIFFSLIFFFFFLSPVLSYSSHGWWVLETGCGEGFRTGPGHGNDPLSAVSRLWPGPSSGLNDFPEEVGFWHGVKLCTLSCTDVWRRPLCPWQWEDEAYFVSKGCQWRGLRLLCCNCYLAIARFRAEFLNLIALDLWDIPALSTVAFFSNNQLFWIVNKKNAAAKSINLMITQHFLAFWLINQRVLLLIIALYCN